MARVLLGWEFGGGLGHMTVLLPIAEALADRHEPVFVVKRLDRSAGLLAERGDRLAEAKLLQAPRWPTPGKPERGGKLVHSLADKLMRDHYNDPALLYANARGWRDILGLVQPALVIGDYSPTLFLAARGLVPTIAVGIPFGLPPDGRPLPPIRPWEKALPETSMAAEQELLQAVRRVQARLGRPPAPFLGDIFNGDRTFPCTLPELDPYRSYRGAPTLMPFNVPAFGAPQPLSSRPDGRVFVYLPADNPHLLTTLEALRRLNLGGDVFVPGLPMAMREHYRSSVLTFHDRPLALEQVLPDARLAIHHGGHGTSYAALRAGVPQLVLVNNLERLVTSYGLDRLKCAVVVNADGRLETDAMAGFIRRLLTSEEIHRSAYKAAQSIAARSGPDPLETIAEACRAALG